MNLKNAEWRHYSFTSFYLSSIQQGIQGAHGLMELFNKYEKIDLREIAMSTGENPPAYLKEAAQKSDMLYEWSQNHKTMICLNGGMFQDLDLLLFSFEATANPYPFASFKESQTALNSTLTNVSIILPDRIYATSDVYRHYKDKDNFFDDPALKIYDFSEFEKELIVMLSSYGLAK